ncbi:MAG TPA: hypothetical protein HA260_00180 [Thermoplasmata archaeon]|nr:hypothetical protein [Thermoplasmata archaeon]
MKRNGSGLTQLIVVLILTMVVVPVVQGGSSDRIQNILPTHNKTLEGEPLAAASSDSVYSLTPDWESSSPHYSTGGAFADFNNDDWLDFIVSDGNDMGQGHVRLYMNDGDGHLPTEATWESADIAYNGHLDVADINGDGWCDVAVSYLGTGSSLGPIARVYMNNNGVLSSAPSWTANIIGNAFGVDFGDMNNDGRPDLAIATGWSYNSYHYHTYAYLNTDGSYGSTPSWQSADQNIYMSVLWVDADDDGWLDLAGIADGTQTQIYRNLGGILETTASWYSTDSANQFGIMLTAGDVTGDGIRELFATDNTQLGGDGYFKQYTGLSTGFFETTHSWGYYGDYGSAVALSDVNGDNLLDLATGAWWFSTNLFLNQGTGLPSSPSWSSTYETVVEKIVFGNIGPSFCEQVFTEQFTAVGDRQLFYLPHRQIQGINSVICDGVTLETSEYTSSRDEGWVTIYTDPQQSLEVTYRYSVSQDMAVTNWDPDIGNYLYYNNIINDTLPQFDHTTYSGSDLECEGSLSGEDITPGATIQGSFTVSNSGDPGSLLNWEVLSHPDWGTWTFTPSSGTGLPSGETITVQVDVIVPDEQNTQYQGIVLLINSDKTADCGEIPVMLKTPYQSLQQSRLFRYPIVLEHLRSIACIFQKPLS